MNENFDRSKTWRDTQSGVLPNNHQNQKTAQKYIEVEVCNQENTDKFKKQSCKC